ncbi:MAG: oligosaccharide flippase family protein, partial [Acidobacteriota bacterium]|nr:oligosaccharide flippase family protein [Acidobacteriota bacterium]
MATSPRAYSDTKLKRGLRLVLVEGEERPIWLRFRRNLSVSLLGAVLSTVIKSGQTLILAKALSLEDYGRVLIVLNLFVFLNTFLGLRVSDLMFRFFRPLEEEGDARAVQGLLLFCLGVSAAIGLLTFGGVLLLSPWLAGQIYRSPALAPLFVIYGCTVLVSSLGDVYGAILRMYDRFTSLVVPQVLGGLTTFVILIAYAATASRYDLRTILAAFAIGVLVQTVPPLIW